MGRKELRVAESASRGLHPHPDLPPSRGKEEAVEPPRVSSPSPSTGEGRGGGGSAPKTQRARELRRNMTDAEKRLWRELRLRQFDAHKFRRQFPLGPYIVDFVCLDARLVIEVDGGQHLDSPEDRRRDAWLATQGFRVLRFWNTTVRLNEWMNRCKP